MKYELKAYSFGDTIGQGFNLYFNNFIFLFLISLIGLVPMTIFGYYIQNPGISNMFIALFILSIVIYIPISVIISGLIIHVVAKKYLDEELVPSDAASTAFKLFFPLLGLSILEAIGISFAMILLIIPGLILAIGWSISTHVLVIEKTGITESLERSWNLTKGHKWGLLGLMIVVGLIVVVVQQAVTMVGTYFSANMQYGTVVSLGIQHFAQSLTNPIMVCVLIVQYFNLRITKEGFGVEKLTEQFSISNNTDQVEG